MLKKYKELKARHKDALLLFRVGDYYEAYGNDAHALNKVFGAICDEYRNQHDMVSASFPYHALDTYLPKLIRSGHRVCICDNIDTQPPTKKRAIGDPQKNNENHIPKGQEDEHHNNQRHGHSR